MHLRELPPRMLTAKSQPIRRTSRIALVASDVPEIESNWTTMSGAVAW